ncbi:MAG TPA: adenylate/guanylate cyclase domain-containing protein [Nitrospirota bacterium]|jgi:class 3 adenylate cyclase
MRPKTFFGLRLKLTLFTILLIAAVGTIASGVTAGKMREVLSSEIREKGIAIAKSVARSSEDALVGTGDELYLFQFITSAMKNTGVKYVRIVDASGIVRADSDIQRSGTKYLPPAGTGAVERGPDYQVSEGAGPDGAPMFDISVPIKLASGDKKIGEVHLGLSGGIIEDAARRISILIGGIALAGLLLGGVGAYTMANLMSAPIKELVKGADEIGRGNLEQNIKVRGRDEIAELTHAFNNMAKGLREKKFMRDTFERYMSKQLAEKLLDAETMAKIELGGEKRYVSILFTDIRGFTTMSENMDPKEVISFLNGYFSMLVGIVFEHGGFIDKFIGDAMMVVYGIPVKSPDDAVRCIKTALAMKDAMRRFNEKRAAEGKLPVHMGIGINSGSVIAGNVGSEERMNYTVVGDAVNFASRLVGLSREEEIIISEETALVVSDNFTIEKRTDATVKGKTGAQHVYEVLGVKNV